MHTLLHRPSTEGGTLASTAEDLSVDLRGDIAVVEICRPPNNFFDATLVGAIAGAFEELARERCRAIVLCSQGKHFCAGAQFSPVPASSAQTGGLPPSTLYDEALRLFAVEIPVVAAVQGGAIGGGLGLACAADFRVAQRGASFSANFSRLGFHHGFGLTVTLPRIVGQQRALEMLYTGRRVGGEEAFTIGLCDRLVPDTEVRDAACALAEEIAASAPLAVRAIRSTMRGGLHDEVRAALVHERAEQDRLARTEDWREGVRATAERRPARFAGR